MAGAQIAVERRNAPNAIALLAGGNGGGRPVARQGD
jgi:hypothetical protein